MVRSWLLALRTLVVAFLLLSNIVVIAYRWLPPLLTPLMLIRCLEHLGAAEAPRLYHSWVPMEQISPLVPWAVMAGEDQLFLQHSGFDFRAIKRAWQQNERRKNARNPKRRRTLGASTISQQTAKNVFLWPGRTWVRKGLEVYFTVLIELWWPKERIMEVYLNSIEMGDGIYGIGEAARRHFGREPAQLSQGQAARIAASLPNPRKYQASGSLPYIVKRQAAIQRQMRAMGPPQFD